MAHVMGVSALFHTLDEDKDWDTFLDIYVYKPDRIEVAKRENQDTHFDDNSDHAFMLNMQEQIEEGDIDTCLTTLLITPNGDDTWRFDYRLNFMLDNGVIVGRLFISKSLSEGKRSETYALRDAIPV
jgi:hypothetical protein